MGKHCYRRKAIVRLSCMPFGGIMKPLRTTAFGVLVLALALFGGAFLYQRVADHNPRYAGVVSIAAAPSYQDPALLERAWALPVAALYRQDGYEFQGNPSFCGPT